MRCTQRAREFAWTGHTQPAEFPLPTHSGRSLPADRDGKTCREAAIQKLPGMIYVSVFGLP